MKELDVRALVGEILVAGFPSSTVDNHAQRLIRHHRVKNILLFSRNVESVSQVAHLTAQLQAFAVESGHETPLIICTDQENGTVRRVAPGMPGLPGNMAVGATQDPSYAYRIGHETARQLSLMGVNMNLAPVLDVNNNPQNPVIGVRSYGESADFVADCGVGMITGLQELGVIACAKHFPGHGDTSVDSHTALPEVSHTRSRLEEIELKPFRRAIAANVDVMMTAHIVCSSIEPNRIPATLSKRVLTDFLRGELGFQGVVTTDCLEMNAISATIGVGEGAVQAILAGADMIMVSHQLERQVGAIESITTAVLSGRLPIERLIQAADRVRALRQKRIFRKSALGLELAALVQASQVLQAEISAKAVTIVADETHMLPLNPTRLRRIDVLFDASAPPLVAADSTTSASCLVDALAKVLPTCAISIHQLSADGADDVRFSETDLVLVGLHGTQNPTFLQTVQQLMTVYPVVVLALQSPYDLAALHGVKTSVALYEYTPWMMEAGVRALLGTGGTGVLPVSVGG